jgi:ketosteroid isomerase-like protein
MSKLLALAGTLTLIAPCVAQTTADQAAAATAVEKADQNRNAAMAKADLAVIDNTTAETYIFTDPKGRVTAKKELMESFKSGAIKIEAQTIRDVRVQLYGNVAVETGELTSKATRDGRDTSGTYRFTRVWVNRGGAWQTVAFQETKPASP